MEPGYKRLEDESPGSFTDQLEAELVQHICVVHNEVCVVQVSALRITGQQIEALQHQSGGVPHCDVARSGVSIVHRQQSVQPRRMQRPTAGA